MLLQGEFGTTEVSFHANWAEFSKLAVAAGVDADIWKQVTPIALGANAILKKAVKDQKTLSEKDIEKMRKDFGTDAIK